MKVLILGSKGFLGTYFMDLFPGAIGERVDITDATAVASALDTHQPDIVINAAGKTGRPNVDWCEDNKEETFASNVAGPLIILDACKERSIYWVHLGAGCIYAGDNGGEGFTEEDEPNFTGSYYAKTKAEIDQKLLHEPVLNLRIRMPFDDSDNPRNLINKIAKYDRVLDVQNSITYIPDFLEAAMKLIESRTVGTFNIVNPGTTSPYDIMVKYKEVVDPTKEFERLVLEDLSEVAKAPRSNCVLSTKKLEEEGITLPPIDQRIEEVMQGFATQITSELPSGIKPNEQK